MYRLRPWHRWKPDKLHGHPHHPDAEELECGKMLGYTRLGLKKVEASKGPPMVLPE